MHVGTRFEDRGNTLGCDDVAVDGACIERIIYQKDGGRLVSALIDQLAERFG
jgi:hypothetical protein